MNKEMVRKKAYERMVYIDESYGDIDLRDAMKEYHKLLCLIYHGKLESYYAAFGWEEIDQAMAELGKQSFRWGKLSLFERHCIKYLAEDVLIKENQNAWSYHKSLPPTRLSSVK